MLMVFLDRATAYDEIKDRQSMGACMQNMLLAAQALGLGTVWIGENFAAQGVFLPLMGINPEEYEYQGTICVGYTDKNPQAPERKPLNEYMLEKF